MSYRLFASVIVPRPIAWVSTIGQDGTPNIAPFSFFNAIGGNPPTLAFSVSSRRGQLKDTVRNIQEVGECVVHIVDEAMAEQMNATAGEYPYETDEFVHADLATLPSVDVRPERLADAPVAMECRVTKIVPVDGTGNSLILAQVVRFHLREGLLRPNGLVDASKLKPVARLGGDEYTTLGAVFEMKRPVI